MALGGGGEGREGFFVPLYLITPDLWLIVAGGDGGAWVVGWLVGSVAGWLAG